MKKRTLPILGALALSLLCTQVFAVDGTITVNGVITDQTCTLQGDGLLGSGLKDITVNLPTLPKSWFTPSNPTLPWRYGFMMFLTNATATGPCDAATSKALKGIHLSAISPTTDLDATDKTLLVNKATGAGGASTTNPILIRIYTEEGRVVDLSAPWGDQVRSGIYRDTINNETYLVYRVGMSSKAGVVDAQNYTAKINYTLHYN